MIDRIKKTRKAIEELEKEKIGVLDIKIVYEIDCQLTKKISDENYCKLYNEIEYAYLKLEGVSLDNVVRCALDNVDKIINNDKTFNLREESCWY